MRIHHVAECSKRKSLQSTHGAKYEFIGGTGKIGTTRPDFGLMMIRMAWNRCG